MNNETFIVEKNKWYYEIVFGSQVFNYYLYSCIDEKYLVHINEIENVDLFVIICDKNIEQLYGYKIQNSINKNHNCYLIAINCDENNKNLKTLEHMIEMVLEKKATRRTCIIALGGGVCGNMAGMVAALLFRGIRFIHIPTSLMAISDSVLSLKQAINSDYGKNLIGTFYQPEMVITNIEFLNTSPKSEIISGICEDIKNSLTILPDHISKLLNVLNKNCVYSKDDFLYFIELAIEAKTLVMKNDPYEKYDGLILEYGHTIGHAIERASKGEITHGEAIGLGMLCAADVSNTLGYLSKEDVNLHKELLKKAGAKVCIPNYLNPNDILSIMRFDNKRGYLNTENEIIHMVLLEKIGKPLYNGKKILTPVSEDIVKSSITKFCKENYLMSI